MTPPAPATPRPCGGYCSDLSSDHWHLDAEDAYQRLAEAERLLAAALHPDTIAMTYVTEDAIRAFLDAPAAAEGESK